jgi:hypothetical protein
MKDGADAFALQKVQRHQHSRKTMQQSDVCYYNILIYQIKKTHLPHQYQFNIETR